MNAFAVVNSLAARILTLTRTILCKCCMHFNHFRCKCNEQTQRSRRL